MVQFINMIIIELNRLKMSDEIQKELNEYFQNINLIDLESIISYIINYFIEKKVTIKIILDQFKKQYFKDWDKVENLIDDENHKLYVIICSSINDDNIRDSFCNTINKCIKGENEIVQIKQNSSFKRKKNYDYFYISNLLDENDLNLLYSSEEGFGDDDKKNGIYEFFDYIPKYVYKIKNAEDISTEIEKINKDIKQKFKDFYKNEGKDINLNLKLASLRNFLECKIPIKHFNDITSNFSFKYFILKCYNNEEEIDFIGEEMKITHFKIKYAFSYISQIIEEMVLDLNDLFFDNNIYQKHTGATIGGFFELVTIDKIKKKLIKLPNDNYNYIINVDRINEMKQIKLTINELLNNEIQIIKTNEGNNIKNSYLKIGEEMNKETLFENENLLPYQQSEIINFENNYLFKTSKIEDLKNEYRIENNVRILDKDNNLIYTTKLFETKQKIKKYQLGTDDNSYNKYHYLKDKNILITQFYENAASYDLAYLFGKPDAKIFLGFQMKSYRDYFQNNRSFNISRENIIKNSKLMLFTSKILFDVDIAQLHYIIIGLYFKNDFNLEEQIKYSNELMKFCKNNKFKLILYEPKEKKFYNDNIEVINEIKIPDKYTNLLEEKDFQIYINFQRQEKLFLQRKTNQELDHDLIELTKKTNNMEQKKLKISQVSVFIEQIKNKLKFKDLRYFGSRLFDDNDYFFPIPQKNFLFLFYRMNHQNYNNLNKFYALFQKEEKLCVYDLEFDRYINYAHFSEYYNLFDKEEKYYIFSFGY